MERAMNEYFIYEGNNSKIINVVNKVNALMNGEEIYTAIKHKEGPYLYSNSAGCLIAASIRAFRTPMKVVLYKSKNPWSAANAYFTPSKPHTIHLNTRKLGRTNASIGASCVHELVHAVDAKEKYLSYGHNGNKYSPEKEQCAPYYIDNIAESLLGGNPVQTMESRHIKLIPIWYKRVFMPWTWF
jgi:hypothetical protein